MFNSVSLKWTSLFCSWLFTSGPQPHPSPGPVLRTHLQDCGNVQENLKSWLHRSHLWAACCSRKLISAGAVTSQWNFKNNCDLITWIYTLFIPPLPPCREVCFLTLWTKLVSIDIVAFICMKHFAAQTSSNYFTFALNINLVRQFNCYVYSNGVCLKREWKIFRSLAQCNSSSHIWDLSADFALLNINDLLCSLLVSIFRQRQQYICWWI